MIRKTIRIPKTMERDGDDEMRLWFSMVEYVGNKRDEQRASMEKILGGDSMLNTGGGGGNWEQRWHA